MPLQAVLSPTGRVALVTPEGELDVQGAPALRSAVRSALGSGVAVVVVDLRAVTFVDSSVLGVLVDAHRSLEPGRRLVVANAHGLVLRVLQLTGLHTVLEVLGPEPALGDDEVGAALLGGA